MSNIQSIVANQILDSRGIPTVEAVMRLDNGQEFRSQTPSGTSTGKYEAVELRDNDRSKYFGMEVTKAISNINTLIAPQLIGRDPSKQTQIDQTLINLDGTPNKSKLGANATLPVSTCALKAGAAAYKLHLFDYISKKYGLRENNSFPIPTFNVINGGKHGSGNLDFQEFHIVPTATKTYPEFLRLAVEIYQSLGKVLTQRNASRGIGIEGGYTPLLYTNKDGFELVAEAIKRTDYVLGKDVFFGLDVSSSHFFVDGRYSIKDEQEALTSEQFLNYFKDLNEKINLFSIEDPFIEDDWKSWTAITAEMSNNTLIVGDDLIATNKHRLERAIQEKACTAIMVKPNQIGTISETVEVVKIAKQAGIHVVASHRSGETNDTFIADFAYGVGAEYTKFGAPSRGERTDKYNRMMEIYRLVNPSQKQTT